MPQGCRSECLMRLQRRSSIPYRLPAFAAIVVPVLGMTDQALTTDANNTQYLPASYCCVRYSLRYFNCCLPVVFQEIKQWKAKIISALVEVRIQWTF